MTATCGQGGRAEQVLPAVRRAPGALAALRCDGPCTRVAWEGWQALQRGEQCPSPRAPGLAATRAFTKWSGRSAEEQRRRRNSHTASARPCAARQARASPCRSTCGARTRGLIRLHGSCRAACPETAAATCLSGSAGRTAASRKARLPAVRQEGFKLYPARTGERGSEP